MIEVIVGNIGTVYSGGDYKAASASYREYRQQSIRGYGRAASEDVTLLVNGEPDKEHFANKRKV